MEIAHISQEYIQAVKDIKSAILKSRYAAAKQANKGISGNVLGMFFYFIVFCIFAL